MQKRKLGGTDLMIAPLVLGGNVFGWTADEKTSFAILDRIVEGGLNAIDTANSYSRFVPGNVGGESETIIGKWLKQGGRRDKVVVITKVGSDMGQGKKDLSPAHIETAVEDSLRRLQTDVIDLYLSHWVDPTVSYAETLGAYQRLIEKGKIRWCGASNHDAAQLREALEASRVKGVARYEVLQPGYNLYDRSEFDGPLRDLCMAENLGVITYSALARGFLSGKYRSKADLGKSPRGARGIAEYLDERGFRILAALDAVCARHAAKPAEVALAWQVARPGVTAPIASATTVDQADSLVRAASLQLTPADIAELDKASAV